MLVPFLVALMTTPPAMAVEVTGQLRGQVTDADGLAIPDAKIHVESPSILGGVDTVTDGDGFYRFPALPPGTYAVTIEKDGFLPYRAEGLLVVTGQVATLNVGMKLSVGSMDLEVVAERPVVDTQKVSSGTVMSRETLRDIPNSGRDYQSATSFAAGVVGGGNPNVRGGTEDSNQYYLDGVNTTDPITGTFSLNMNFDAIEEVQVITGGMDAEYGRSMGGAVNIVTRSGGNVWSGDVQYLTSGKWSMLYEPLEGEEEPAGFYDHQVAINLGGPIVKDRLWFFSSFQGNLSLQSTTLDPSIVRPEGEEQIEPRDWKSLFWFGKLTWMPAPAHRVWFQAQGDPTKIINTEQDPYTLSNGETVQEQGGYLMSAGHLWTPDPRTILQTQLYYQQSYINVYSVNCMDSAGSVAAIEECATSLPDRWWADDPDGFNGGSYPYAYLSVRNRISANTNFTRFFSNFLGEHQAKTGAQWERLYNESAFPGVTDLVYKTYGDGSATDIENYQNSSLLAYDSDLRAEEVGQLMSWYLQDVWNPWPRLTIRPGVRLDYAVFKNDVGDTVFNRPTIAPRIGAAYELTGDGRTSVHAYYGRFYDSGFLKVSDLLHSRSQGYSFYGWDAEAGDWSDEPQSSAAAANVVHNDLVNPWADEYDIGVTRDLGGGWALDITGTYEYAQNFWEDDEVNAIWNADGTNVIGFRSGEATDYYRIRTMDDAFTQYTSVEISVNRQFSDVFGMLSSYTWGRSYGNVATSAGSFVTGVFDNPEQAQYEVGLQPYDSTHVLKVAGAMRDPTAFKAGDNFGFGYILGWNFGAQTGYPYTGYYYNQYYQGWSNQYDNVDGSYRLPMYSQTDLKVGLTFAAGRSTFDATVECFNVFNDRGVTSVDTTYGNETGDGPYLGDDGYPIFGQPTTRQDPRYLQIGFRGEF